MSQIMWFLFYFYDGFVEINQELCLVGKHSITKINFQACHFSCWDKMFGKALQIDLYF